ncbi:hypothetical protein N2152v2_007244 [Parachlorella kessleri]
MDVDVRLIAELQRKTDRIRNICVLAHVDHGKTTLSDHLIASNGLIHPRLAGELRYMDSKEEEQARGITMKSSSISLLFVPGAALRPDGPGTVSRQEKLDQGYLVNLIDSPGHVDFCSEVSTAARLCDGAFVVVDAVEGVCIQTHAVLRQAFEEKVRLCLVINKVDRLILELRLTPLEAYERLKSIIAHVNMIISAFHSERYISEADSVLAYEDAKAAHADGAAHRQQQNGGGEEAETEEGEEEEEEEEQEFSPEKGNVAFASAYDGWAFRISQFAEMYAAKMGCKASALERALWGEYAYQAKTKRIVRIQQSQYGTVKPLFVQLALEPLWKAYGACEPGEDHKALLAKMVAGLGLGGRVTERALAHPEARAALRAVLRAWLPLADATLQMAAEHLPSPVAAAPDRLPRLLPPRTLALKGHEVTQQLAQLLEATEAALRRCSADPEAPCVVYVSKMVAVPANALPRATGEPGPANPAEERFLAFGRVFSGVLRAGQAVHVLHATYNPADPATGAEAQAVALGALYLMMGRGLERLQEVPAGNVLAVAGLDLAILKSATVASSPLCRPLAPMLFQSAPIVRVAVEPAHPGEMPALAEGLRLLHRADPLVQVSVQDTGEHVVAAAGEIHLETCIKDLRERFARVELLVSPPLVAFRETVACPTELPPEVTPKPPRVVEATTPNGACTLRVRAVPLPAALAVALDQHTSLLARLSGGPAQATRTDAEQPLLAAPRPPSPANGDLAGTDPVAGEDAQSLEAFGARLAGLAREEGKDTRLDSLLQRAWMFGPRRTGPNILLASPPTTTHAAAADGASAARQEGASSSLFEAPSGSVYRLSKQGQHGRAHAHGAAPQEAAAAAAAAAADDGEEQLQQGARQAVLGLGFPKAAQKLGLVEGRDTGSSHARAVAAELASQVASLDLTTTEHAQHGQQAQHAHQPQQDGSSTGEGQQNGGAAASHQGAAASGSAALREAASANGATPQEDSGAAAHSRNIEYLRVESGVVAGFQMATAAGPLCDEPMWGVAFEVEARLNLGDSQGKEAEQADLADSYLQASPGCDTSDAAAASLRLAEDVYGPFSGQVTSAARQALRRAVLEGDPRLAEALFLCEVSTSSEALSGVYAVLGRRRARILREEMREGSDYFIVHAYLPAEASFGFADELRRRSSGAAAASLLLSHWERLQVDPFFVPTTEEDREEFGEEGQGVGVPNLAKRLIDAVRRRKGLPVEEKVVESATKQRTRARKV